MGLDESKTSLYLQQFHSGDEEGLNALLDRHMEWIYARVRKRLGPKMRQVMESADVVQDAAVQFLRYGPKIVVESDSKFRGLMAKIVENILRDQHDWFTALRRDMDRNNPPPNDTVLYLDGPVSPRRSPSQSAQEHEREEWIRLGMLLIDPSEKEVILLKELEKLTYEKIGKKLGISTDAARMRYNRAVTRLSEKVGELRRGKFNEGDDP